MSSTALDFARDARAPWTNARTLAYAAPAIGLYFFNIPMYTILPGVYAKYFGLSLGSIAAVVLIIRLFDGVITPTIGYCSDWHRSRGGSRKSWVFVGGIGASFTCYFLYMPPQPVTTTHYLLWSLLYFLAHSIAEVSHTTWGSELTTDYEGRASIYGARTIMANLGFITFYVLALAPFGGLSGYTTKELQIAAYVGSLLTAVGLVWAAMAAPSGRSGALSWDSNPRSLLQSITGNRPLLLYFAAFACVGLCYGMWFGVLFLYLDSYLGLGSRIPFMFLGATIVAVVSTPIILKLIYKTSKQAVWAAGVILFGAQLIVSWFVVPGVSWLAALTLIIVAHLCFATHNVAAMSLLADIVDYGKLKFRRDRGATYFGCNLLIFQFGLGLGGGLAIAVAGWFGFQPSSGSQSTFAALGLRLAFIILPGCLALAGLAIILRIPLNRRRHLVIQRRLESLLARNAL